MCRLAPAMHLPSLVPLIINRLLGSTGEKAVFLSGEGADDSVVTRLR